MSIDDVIAMQVGHGALAELPPLLGPTVRRLYVRGELCDQLQPPFSGRWSSSRLAALRASLDHFSSGGLISISLEPYAKSKDTFLAPLDPRSDEVWDIRSIAPRPGIRALGCFAGFNAFVIIEAYARTELDGPGGPLWDAALKHCKSNWRKLALVYPAHRGDHPSEYISNFFVAS